LCFVRGGDMETQQKKRNAFDRRRLVTYRSPSAVLFVGGLEIMVI
jgi:hypothetical protein